MTVSPEPTGQTVGSATVGSNVAMGDSGDLALAFGLFFAFFLILAILTLVRYIDRWTR